MADVKLVLVFKSGAVHSLICDHTRAEDIASDFYNETGTNPDVTGSNINHALYANGSGLIRARAADLSAVLVEKAT
ncbi:hypothetical protein [Ruegeria arenilitoris]|uniref:hypothetical protein n=1 Tax=Ruegeria arenilitoris TaxID=1173585 RepID=UPI00147BFF6D|nr:hypothetical protein [Ruegeria arenilitoris]